ncbi:glycosyltransferase [Rhodobacterales bacterium LSUCC1028]|nr:glycosyltransferase [Rhodobacterales bacterium LSUCC1028]
MKILVISQYFWPENFRLNDLCIGLSDSGHEVVILTGLPNYPDGRVFSDFIASPDAYSSLRNMNIIRVPLIPRGRSKFTLLLNYLSFMVSCSILGPLQLRKEKFDIVLVCQLSPATVAIPAIIISKLKKTPLVMWVLDLWPDSLTAVGVVKSKRIMNFLQFIMNRIYQTCDLLIVQSKSFQKRITELTNRRPLVTYIPTWAEEQFNQYEANVRIDKIDEHFTVTFAGNIGIAQDVYCIIKAAKILKNHKDIIFNIVGDGREAARVKKTIDDYGLSDTVKMLGHHPLEKMPKFFGEADAMLVTLEKSETFAMTIPGKLQSYLAAGKPIIGAIDGEARRIIEEANAGFCVSSGDYSGLAKNILTMASMEPQKLAQLGQNGKLYSEKEFSREKIINKFVMNMEEVIQR